VPEISSPVFYNLRYKRHGTPALFAALNAPHARSPAVIASGVDGPDFSRSVTPPEIRKAGPKTAVI
jgi:hypothetical protein